MVHYTSSPSCWLTFVSGGFWCCSTAGHSISYADHLGHGAKLLAFSSDSTQPVFPGTVVLRGQCHCNCCATQEAIGRTFAIDLSKSLTALKITAGHIARGEPAATTQREKTLSEVIVRPSRLIIYYQVFGFKRDSLLIWVNLDSPPPAWTVHRSDNGWQRLSTSVDRSNVDEELVSLTIAGGASLEIVKYLEENERPSRSVTLAPAGL